MDEKQLAKLMKNNPDLRIDPSSTALPESSMVMTPADRRALEIWHGRKADEGEKQFSGIGKLIEEQCGFETVHDIKGNLLYTTLVPINEIAGRLIANNPPPSISPKFSIDGFDPNFKSKTERLAWFEWLPTVEHIWADYEPMTLRVAGAGYTPDFVLMCPDARLWFIEVKGSGGWKAHLSGRSSKRSLRQCAKHYAWLGDFYLLMKIPNRDGGGWHFEQY